MPAAIAESATDCVQAAANFRTAKVLRLATPPEVSAVTPTKGGEGVSEQTSSPAQYPPRLQRTGAAIYFLPNDSRRATAWSEGNDGMGRQLLLSREYFALCP